MGRKENGKGPKTSPEWNNDDSRDGNFSCSVGWVQQGNRPYRASSPLLLGVEGRRVEPLFAAVFEEQRLQRGVGKKGNMNQVTFP